MSDSSEREQIARELAEELGFDYPESWEFHLHHTVRDLLISQKLRIKELESDRQKVRCYWCRDSYPISGRSEEEIRTAILAHIPECKNNPAHTFTDLHLELKHFRSIVEEINKLAQDEGTPVRERLLGILGYTAGLALHTKEEKG